MKKCPECGAKIQENARFCLYCMTSFEEKQKIEEATEISKRWLYIIAAVALGVILLVFCIFAFVQNGNEVNESDDTALNGETDTLNEAGSDEAGEETVSADSELGEEPDTADKENDKENIPDNKGSAAAEKDGVTADGGYSDEGADDTIGGQSSGGMVTGNADTTANNKTDRIDKSKETTTSATTTSNSTAEDTTAAQTTKSEETTSKKEETTESPAVQPKYSYEDATKENTYPTGYNALKDPQNAIVITKVDYVEPGGNYVIPNTIDGKTVVAIMPMAFSGSDVCSTVKSVTLPSSVKTVWSGAFKGCVNLKDLYIKSGVIALYKDAFCEVSERAETLNIYCAKDCRNFNFYYYRNIASEYGALYKEWNG